MATDDKTNDEMDAEAEPLWLLERSREVVNRLAQIFEPYVDRRVSMMLRKNPNIDEDDAKQNGWFALSVGAERFDHTRGIRFTTFIQRRVDGAIVDAARDADEAPTKLRTAEKKGEIGPLPIKHRLETTFDAVAREEHLPEVQTDIAELLLVFAGTSVAEDLALALDCGFDFEEMALRMGVTVAHAIYTVKQAFEHARDPEAYLEAIRNRPAYTPPEPGSCRVQQRMFDGAA